MSNSCPTTSRREPPTTFADLNAAHPLRLIDGAQMHQASLDVLDSILRIKEPTRDQQEYVATLAELIAVYENHHDPIRRMKPGDALRTLCQRNNVTASALGRMLGNRSLGSKLLTGERQLSKQHIRVLSRHFGVLADVLLG